ncbi:MAG: hypothetical protein WD623_07620 [Marinobacter sp.]|uniref:hypothetical protein n=1 Tax=Marinobacter sp. TaxID=50741 RepID=UPI0034A07BE1
MISQTVKATTAAESHYRISAPNSKGRSSLVLGLEASSASLLGELAGLEWNGARFRTVVPTDDAGKSAKDLNVNADDLVLQAPDGELSRLSDELASTDVVVMFARSGEAAQAASVVGEAAFGRRLMTAGFVLDEQDDRKALEATLTAVRPFVISLVVGPDAEAFSETLSAIRA